MIYVTSDLHGIHPDEFMQLLRRSGFTQRDYLFVLGDVIDRGEYGADLLLWLTEQPNVQLLLGNHEALMLSCSFLFDEVTDENLDKLTIEQLRFYNWWMKNGAAPTIKGLRRILKQTPELFDGIMEYLHDSPLYDTLSVNGRKFVLVHAGLDHFSDSRPLSDYDQMELLWVRPTLDTKYYSDATVIFGHTPTELYGEEYIGRAVRTDSWICIDTGVSLGHKPMLLRLDDLKEFY